MNKFIFTFIFCFFVFAGLVKSQAASVDSESLKTELQLPLPDIPADVTEPQERARYFLEHYWDAMNFNNKDLLENTEFIETSFATFVSIYPHSDERGRMEGTNKLVNLASVNNEAVSIIANLADKYLFGIESPVYSEEYYILFLKAISDKTKDEALKERTENRLDLLCRNLPGRKAADFSFEDSKGNEMTLFGMQIPNKMLLIFYDPDCHSCGETLDRLKEDNNLKNKIDSDNLVLLAVYSGENKELWDETKTDFPESWKIGYEEGLIYDEDIYYLRDLPSIYLLDSDKKVIIKNISPSQISELLIGL